ncbi:uncharacterized protein LOC111395370 [Olea europaea var. sylvestris]|uniref:uncharacterized protein LOC111395370 n=1 Tax=Olea europaea var. sylvestris TaxID=158386 RepID=UPI000C1D44F8|nr:uncharacterized protein LOC111395370 [Olea europaea var. sylvestris]
MDPPPSTILPPKQSDAFPIGDSSNPPSQPLTSPGLTPPYTSPPSNTNSQPTNPHQGGNPHSDHTHAPTHPPTVSPHLAGGSFGGLPTDAGQDPKMQTPVVNQSVVYGDNIPVMRVDLWDDFVARHGGFAHLPWVVMGDFNSVLSPSEVAGGSSSWPAWQDDLGNCITIVGLANLKFDDCLYTWSNKHVSDLTLKKLDRVLVNSKGEEEFSGSSATFLTAGVSDHSPMVVRIAELLVWGERVARTPMFCFCSKLNKLKLALKDFNKEHFLELPTRVTQARTDIEHVQYLIQQSPLDSSLHREESRLQKELCELSRAEEGILRQKARVKWLNLGNQNTVFFFKAMKSHYSKSKVVSICKDDGTRVEEPHEVSEVIVAFYQNLLGQQPSGESLDTDLLRKALPKSISVVHNENLNRDVTFKEIKEVLFSLKDNKAPGPDAFNAGFFKRA